MKRYVSDIEDISNFEPIESMAQIGIDRDAQMAYYVNPDPSRIGEPYFKVYDRESYVKSTRIARISFLEPRYIQHKDTKKPWILNHSEKRRLLQFLNDPSIKYSGASNWEYALYQWNNEHLLLNEAYNKKIYKDEIDAYIRGFYDIEENLDNPSYLPSNLPVPDYMKL